MTKQTDKKSKETSKRQEEEEEQEQSSDEAEDEEEQERDDSETDESDEDNSEESEEEDDESAAAAKPAAKGSRGAAAGEDDEAEEEEEQDEEEEEQDEEEEAEAPAEPEDPYWWTPHAVLGALVLIGVLGFFGVFNKAFAFLAGKRGSTAPETPVAAAPPAKPSPAPFQPPSAQQQPREMFGAKHMLVMYKGGLRAPPNVTRTKEEAKARAEEALKKAKSGKAKFEDLVAEYSDEPGAAQRGGDLGQFAKGRMVPEFQAGLEKTKVGEISDLVETPFGYHIILRTK